MILYTEKHGKIRAKAKGIRKPLARMTGFLEPLNLVEMRLVSGKTMDIVTGVESLDFFENAKKDLPRISTGYYLAELLDLLLHDREKNIKIWELLLESLRALSYDINIELLRAYFALNLLAELGYRPELQVCIKCGKKLIKQDHFYFNISGGGILGEECASPAQRDDSYRGKKIGISAVIFLRFLLQNSFKKALKLKIDSKILSEGSQVINALVCQHISRELRTPKFCALVNHPNRNESK